MNVLETMTQDTAYGWRVVIPGEAGAAISQLTDAEQEAVRRGLAILQRYGVHDAPAHSIDKLDSPEPLYALRVPDAPDVRVVVRVAPDATIEVEDVVRSSTLRNVFHAHASSPHQ